MKKILVLGAGKSTPYLIHRLLEQASDRDWQVTVADRSEALAAERVGAHDRGRSIAFDVNETEQRDRRIGEADVVINMLAPRFLDLIAHDCVRHGTPMLCASYRDAAVRDLDADARGRGVLLLCELGLDPGIDHMSTMALIERIRGDGGHIRGFRSYGSGIPAPESQTNPLRYAITWNPRNVVMSSEHGAQYMEEGRIKLVPWHHVFHHTWTVEVEGVGTLEAYPNRDSLSYMQAFGLDEVRTMVRGTLRYPGWSETWAQIVALGLPNETLRIPGLADRTYREVVEMFLPLNLSREDSTDLSRRIGRFLGISPTGRIMDNLRWLGLLSDERIGCEGDTAAAMLIHLLQEKMPLGPEDRDMVILLHELDVEYEDGRSPERVTSTLVARGEGGGFTAMAKSVGLPVAIATELLLSGALRLTGAQIPLDPSVYRPQLEALAAEGLAFTESRHPTG